MSVEPSPCLRLTIPAENGVTPSGQMMPLSSCEASMIAPARRLTPIPCEPMCTGTRAPSGVTTVAPIGSEYLVPK